MLMYVGCIVYLHVHGGMTCDEDIMTCLWMSLPLTSLHENLHLAYADFALTYVSMYV